MGVCGCVQGRKNTRQKAIMHCTCRLLSGSIFITGPMVLRGREMSMLWLGISGV